MQARQRRESWNADLDAAIDEAAERLSLGAVASAGGIVTVALNEEGQLCEFRPDGTSTPLR